MWVLDDFCRFHTFARGRPLARAFGARKVAVPGRARALRVTGESTRSARAFGNACGRVDHRRKMPSDGPKIAQGCAETASSSPLKLRSLLAAARKRCARSLCDVFGVILGVLTMVPKTVRFGRPGVPWAWQAIGESVLGVIFRAFLALHVDGVKTAQDGPRRSKSRKMRGLRSVFAAFSMLGARICTACHAV